MKMEIHRHCILNFVLWTIHSCTFYVTVLYDVHYELPLKTLSVTVCFSSSVCNQSSGLEALGLADIRILVRLMCLAAGGRVHTGMDRQGVGRGSVSDRTGSAFLSFLSSAIGGLVFHSSAAYRELVDICTQVHSLSLSLLPPNHLSCLLR